MNDETRRELIECVVDLEPTIGAFVRDMSGDLTAGSWDMVSYSFQQGFEALWDVARADHRGLLDRPLLLLWRQSVELSFKAALREIAGEIKGRPGHDLRALFQQLLDVRAEEGWCDDDDLARTVQAMIAIVQGFDPAADRFRYPAERGGKPHAGVAVDLDQLYQAHWVITTWCEGAVLEMRGDAW